MSPRARSSPRRRVCSLQHVDEALDVAEAPVSLNRNIGSEDDGELGDLFADPDAVDPAEEATESMRRLAVRARSRTCPSASGGSSSSASASTARPRRWRRSARSSV